MAPSWFAGAMVLAGVSGIGAGAMTGGATGTGAGGPGGIGVTGLRFSATRMKAFQNSAGAEPPVMPRIGELSSRPIQTTVVKSPEKPQNQASRKSDVVPVLPAIS